MKEEEPNIQVTCPGCEREWMTDSEFSGFDCPNCGHRVTKSGQPAPKLRLIQGGKGGKKE